MLGVNHLRRSILLLAAALAILGAGWWLAGYRSGQTPPAASPVQSIRADVYSLNGTVAGQGRDLIRVKMFSSGTASGSLAADSELKTINFSGDTRIYSVAAADGILRYQAISASDLQTGEEVAVYSATDTAGKSVLSALRVETGSYFASGAFSATSSRPFAYESADFAPNRTQTCIISVHSNLPSGWMVKGLRNYAGSGDVGNYDAPVGYYSLSPEDIPGYSRKISIGSIQVSSDFTALCAGGKVLPFDVEYSAGQ